MIQWYAPGSNLRRRENSGRIAVVNVRLRVFYAFFVAALG